MATSALVSTLRDHGIAILTEKDDDFRPTLQSFTFIHEDKIPGVVALPTTGEQVAAVVKACIAAKREMTVRGRGHDTHGRYAKEGTVCIDMRNINSVSVSPDKKTATIGAGASSLKVLDDLAPHGLVAATGGCPDVGFCGWSVTGGYGPFSSMYGMGTDQIVGAMVVNADGKLVDADESLLKGIRGGGGMFGVIVSLTVTVHPLDEIQGGLIMFDNKDLTANITSFMTGYQALASQKGAIPRHLKVSPLIIPAPGVGTTLAAAFVWSGPPSDTYRLWLNKIASLAPLLHGSPSPADSIMSTKPNDFLRYMGNFFPKQNWGRIQSALLSRLSAQVIASLAKHAASLPPGGGGIILHGIAQESPACEDDGDLPDAVTPYRKPHHSLEILGLGTDEESGARLAQWALDARAEFVVADAALESTYIPLTDPRFFDVRKVFGDKYAELERLKRLHDPENVFKNTHPRLAD